MTRDTLGRWGMRFLLSFATSISIGFTALICAWLDLLEYQRQLPWLNNHPLTEPSLWEFMTRDAWRAQQVSCLLASSFVFPICLMCSTMLDNSRPGLLKTAVATTLTALFAIGAAVAMASLHYAPVVDHH